MNRKGETNDTQILCEISGDNEKPTRLHRYKHPRGAGFDEAIRQMLEWLETDNPRFNSSKFEEAIYGAKVGN